MAAALLASTLTLLAACTDNHNLLVPSRTASRSVSDASHGDGNSHFFFLPPLARSDGFNGKFDGTLSPIVSVCTLAAGHCTARIVSFSTEPTSENPIRVSQIDEAYQVNWKPDHAVLVDDGMYRVTVAVGGYELGHIDIRPVSGKKSGPLAPSTTGDGIWEFQSNATIPIAFRIESGAVVPPSDQALVAELHAVLTATNPIEAAAAWHGHAAQLFASLDPLEAQRRLVAIHALAFDVARDRPALTRLGLALNGGSLTLGPSASLLRASTTQVSTAVEQPITTLIYINGVNTDPLKAGETLLALEALMRDSQGWRFTDGAFRGQYFYNKSFEYDTRALSNCAFLEAFKPLVFIDGRLQSIVELLFCTTAADFVESAGQLLNLMTTLPVPAADDAIRLRDMVRRELSQNRNVILVGHSQGNLMIQQALIGLSTDERACTGVVSIASPSSTFPIERSVPGVVVAGAMSTDFIRLTTLNHFTPYRNVFTDVADDDIDQADLIYKPYARAFWSVWLHDVLADYLTAAETRAAAANGLIVEQNGLVERCSSPVQPELRDAYERLAPALSSEAVVASVRSALRSASRALQTGDHEGALTAVTSLESLVGTSENPAAIGDQADVSAIALAADYARDAASALPAAHAIRARARTITASPHPQ